MHLSVVDSLVILEADTVEIRRQRDKGHRVWGPVWFRRYGFGLLS